MGNYLKTRKEDFDIFLAAFLIVSLLSGSLYILSSFLPFSRDLSQGMYNVAFAAQATQTPSALTANISETLSFTVTNDNFGSITAGATATSTATSTLSVNTNNASGWFVNFYGDNQGSGAASTTMYVRASSCTGTRDYNTGITDQTEWVNGAATTSAGNAVAAASLASSGQVLAFRVMTASSTNGTPFFSTSWWGTNDSEPNTLWAGIASSTVYRQIGNAGLGSYSASNHINTVQYILRVPSTQQAGCYEGPLTFSATTNP